MEVEINIWAVLLATLVAMFLGAVWYSKPLLGKQWMKLAGVTEEKARQNSSKAMMRATFSAFLVAYVLSHSIAFAIYFYPERSPISVGFSTAFFIWVGYYLSNHLMMDGFELRPLKLTFINAGYHLLTLVAMALIIAQITY